MPQAAALGLAGPVGRGPIRFVNSDWVVDPDTFAADLGLDSHVMLNDFGAVAHAVSVLGPEELEPVCGPDGPLPAESAISVMGLGTGLGVALLLRRAGRTEVIETEASHIGFAPLDEDERRFAADIAGRYGRASVERLVSGPALLDLYRLHGGGPWDSDDAGALWSAAIEGRDLAAALALERLVGMFGAAAGDLSLAHGSAAVVIAGSLANRIAPLLRSPLFRDRFQAKGRYRARMATIPVFLATVEEPGLLGAAIAYQRRYGPDGPDLNAAPS